MSNERPDMPKLRIPLDNEELETILVIARNRQSGRIMATEIEELVRAYREMLANKEEVDELELETTTS